MKLQIHTPVSAPIRKVWEGFDKSLFLKLSPPFPPIRLLRFDGSHRGDTVSLELNFFLFREQWTSLITEQESDQEEIYFIDKGIKLPFFLTYWRHKHRLLRRDTGTLIADEIEYRTPYVLFDYLMYPVFWAQFAYRKPIYKEVFQD